MLAIAQQMSTRFRGSLSPPLELRMRRSDGAVTPVKVLARGGSPSSSYQQGLRLILAPNTFISPAAFKAIATFIPKLRRSCSSGGVLKSTRDRPTLP